MFYSSHIEFVYQAGRQLQPVDNASVKKILSFSNDRFGIKVFVFRFVSVPVKWIRTSSRIVGLGDIVGRKWVFQFKSSANLVMRGCVHARRTLKGLVADLRFYKKNGLLNGDFYNHNLMEVVSLFLVMIYVHTMMTQ